MFLFALTEAADKNEPISASLRSPRQDESTSQNVQSSDKDESALRATTTLAVEEEEEKRKGAADEEDDERSKMSARDPAVSDEQRGANVEYRPTYGEREGEQERVGDGHSAGRPGQGIPTVTGSGQETYTQSANQGQTHASPKESPQGNTASSVRTGDQGAEQDNTRPESPKSIPATSTASERDDVEEVVRLAKTPGKKSSPAISIIKDFICTVRSTAVDFCVHNPPVGLERKNRKE